MKSKLNKTKQRKQYLGRRRIKNNKYQAAQLGELCTKKKKNKGEANTHGEREREREIWWCGSLKYF